MSLTTKEAIGNVKNPNKDEHEDENDDWEDGDSDSDFGNLVRVSIVGTARFVCELTMSAVSSSPIHSQRLQLPMSKQRADKLASLPSKHEN